jgi:glyoxylase-like metal-dependent hydrolase (beta-lactamase superfamily II)
MVSERWAISSLMTASLFLGGFLGGFGLLRAQPNPSGAPQKQDFAGVQIQVFPVQGNVYMLVGEGGNISVQVGSDGVLLVDTMFAALAPRIAAEIKKLVPGPIRFIIDTNMDADHTGGNSALAKMGAPGASPPDSGGATIIAHENVVNRMSKENGESLASNSGLPNDEYFTPTKDFYFNGEPIFVIHEANAHTDGDSIVLFRRSDVIAAGDIFTPDRYPVIEVERGGSVQGLLEGLNHILHLTVPAKLQEGGTRVIPGHGRLCDEADVVEYRNMVAIVRDRVQAMIRKGMTLEQVKAAQPTFDYDTQYGSGGAFTEAVFKSLSNPKPAGTRN